MYKIEKNVEIPKTNPTGRNGKNKYILASLNKMEIMDSIFIKGINEKKRANIRCVIQKIKDNKYVTRQMDGGLRIWRIK